jgi:molybdopterin molybdotransferase
MISLYDALKIIEKETKPLSVEKTDMLSSLGRVIAEDIFSDTDMPPFDKSAMDGYACKFEDLDKILVVNEIIPAGKKPEMKIAPGTCSKIMTGSMIPDGADCVIMVEEVYKESQDTIRFTGKASKSNIVKRGTDIRSGDLMILKGTLVKPQHIAVLATVGATKPLVYKIPDIAIISTGNELVEPFIKPGISQIRNSNAWQLMSQCQILKTDPRYYGIVKDEPSALEETIAGALNGNDIIILTGGVSAGDFDFVPEILKKLNVSVHFDSISVQPGRPTMFGSSEGKLIFALPGNPVSSFLQFELLVKKAIYWMMGHNLKPISLKMELGVDYERKKTERLSLIPVNFDNEAKIFPVEYHGSAHINSLLECDGIIYIPPGVSKLNKGSFADVRQL